MEIVERGATKVVGLQVVATWEELWQKVPKAWRIFAERYTAIEHRMEVPLLDVSLGKQGETYVELVAAQVSTFGATPEGMVELEIPRQDYIFYRHTGPVEEIADSFGKIYQWAEKNGIPAGEMKIDQGYTPGGNDLYHDLYVKVDKTEMEG